MLVYRQREEWQERSRMKDKGSQNIQAWDQCKFKTVAIYAECASEITRRERQREEKLQDSMQESKGD